MQFRQKTGYLVPLIIIALGGFLRFSLLTHQSLWYDEGVALELTDGNSIQTVFDAMWGRGGGDKYQPLYYVLLFLWRQIFGSSEVALRTLSVFPGIASLILVFLLAQKIYGYRHAIWSALLISVSAFCIYFSQEVRPFSLQLFLGLVQLYCFTDILVKKEKITWRNSIPFAVITVINFFGGILLVLFSLAMAVSHLVAYRQIRQWLVWWSPVVLLSLPALLYYLASPAAANPSGDSTNSLGLPLYKNAAFVIYSLLVGSSYGPPLEFLRGSPSAGDLLVTYGLSIGLFLGVAVLILIAILLLIGRQIRTHGLESNDLFWISLIITSFILSAVLAAISGINWMPRHSFFVYLPLCIFLPRILILGEDNRATSEKFSWRRTLPAVALSGLVFLNIGSTSNYFFNPDHWRDDYRSAAQYLTTHRQVGEPSILLWGTPRLLAYYGDSKSLDGRGIKAEELGNELGHLTNQANTVYLAVNRESLWQRASQTSKVSPAEVLSDSYDLKEEAKFINFAIYKLERRISEL